MDKILNGVVNFQEDEYIKHRQLFQDLSKQQAPHTLFIGCSDSRLVPNLITQTVPGELFVIRNIGNMVPPYRNTEEYVATTAAIEYALEMFTIENIIVCGHSNCGGCAALYQEEAFFERMPHVRKWIQLSDTVRKNVEALKPRDIDHRSWLTEQLNIVEQIRHLFSYPGVKTRYEQQSLKVLGWYYEIETGAVFNYNHENGHFEPIGTN
jgi:carbonic anhydrase